MPVADIVHILEAITAMCVALTALLAAAMPLIYRLGLRQPRPEEHAAVARATTAEAAAERVKGELAEVRRASQLPPAPPMDRTVNIDTKPAPPPEPPEAA